jgi:Tfp pilus assembly protein PilX
MLMTDSYHRSIGPRRSRSGRSRQRQTGAATLAVAVIMLLVVSVLVFHSHTAGWLEQRATANQARAKQAHAAAEAGLEEALAVLNADTGSSKRDQYLTVASPGTFNGANVALTPSTGAGLTYEVTFTLIATAPANTFRLESDGGSDCTSASNLSTCTSRARVSQAVRVIGFSRLPAISSYSNPPFTSQAAFFESIFSASQTEIQALATTINSGASLGIATSGLVWHQGNLDLNKVVGSAANPVLLVVEGNLTLQSQATIYGFVYVTGNLTCNLCMSSTLNPDQRAIQGAVATAGANNLAGENVNKPPAVPVPNVMTRLDTTAPRFAKVIGTWRDW